jgi:hypothetical protein
MSIISGATLAPLLAECGVEQVRYDMLESSDATGSQAARLFGPPRWRLAVRSKDAFTLVQAGAYEAVLLQLRGGVNHLSMYDPVRTAPQGTVRGTLTLNGSHSAGVTAISVTAGVGQSGLTLKAGDWLQIGTGLGTSQLVKVMADATVNGSGVIALTVEPPLRTAFSTGAAVTWDKPLAYYKQQGTPQWSYRPGMRMRQGGFALDLLESWG